LPGSDPLAPPGKGATAKTDNQKLAMVGKKEFADLG
jgi:hypothetical protein